MFKILKFIIQRRSDNKWLLSIEDDTWTDDKNQATRYGFVDRGRTESKLIRKKYSFNDYDVFSFYE